MADTKDYDHIHQYLSCANGAWDMAYIRRIVRHSFYLNRNSNTTMKEWKEQLAKVRRLPQEELREHLKDYKRYRLRYTHTNR